MKVTTTYEALRTAALEKGISREDIPRAIQTFVT